ncbi:MAG: class II fructose-bisphosphate aldolase [Verrucomicrobiota bacterium JB024]|nr:class II fructose-bisphosphate aldolase [Verrucomicrobiota bacterium JB024]
MKILSHRDDVLARLQGAQRAQQPLFCPNAESPDEIQGLLAGAERFACERGLERVTLGMGITASYPEHAQLMRLYQPAPGEFGEAVSLVETAHLWLDGIELYARPGRFPHVEVIPFLDHGWAPDPRDRAVMDDAAFQERMGIIMFDASAYELEENVRLTRAYAERVGGRVVVEACPDKILSHAQLEKAGPGAAQVLTDPAVAADFVRRTGVDLIVPSLGTEHRGEPGANIYYRRELARELTAQVGPILALHGTSSLGGKLSTVGEDGICKVNFYTAMATGASKRLYADWQSREALTIGVASGAYVYATRRDACAETCHQMLTILAGA